ncbi:MAG: hypothetical protein AAGB34_09260, partial [Planctomycetota bacterium]
AASVPPTKCTDRFTWLTDASPDGSVAWSLDKFLETADEMMGRRGIEVSAGYAERARTLSEGRR